MSSAAAVPTMVSPSRRSALTLNFSIDAPANGATYSMPSAGRLLNSTVSMPWPAASATVSPGPTR